MRFKKLIAGVLAVALPVLSVTGCGNGQSGKDDGKVKISVGNWPLETDKARYERNETFLKEFNKKYPDITVEKNTWAYDTKSFMLKASANQLPTLYYSMFTEADKIHDGGYYSDITDAMEKYGFSESINPSLLELLTDDNGRIFAIPTEAYAQGLYINKKLFREAGLVNEDGSIKIPDTYQEMAEFAQIIKEKTGKAGFSIPTVNNGGGWNFLNIAWAFGVEFETQTADGKWKAAFDSNEFKNALKYVYDLKWKYNALPDNSVVDIAERNKLFGTYQAGMIFMNPPASALVTSYGMNKDDIMVARMPKGEYGRFSQMGGNFCVVAPNASPEQIDACFKWLETVGVTPKVTDESVEALRAQTELKIQRNEIVLDRSAFSFWINPEREKAEQQVYSEYTNVDPADYDDYFSFKDVIIQPEPSAACQELYAALDKVIQEVITNKNVDIDAVTKTAVKDFQKNVLDRLD